MFHFPSPSGCYYTFNELCEALYPAVSNAINGFSKTTHETYSNKLSVFISNENGLDLARINKPYWNNIVNDLKTQFKNDGWGGADIVWEATSFPEKIRVDLYFPDFDENVNPNYFTIS